MDIIVNLAEGFMGLFDAGAETFVGSPGIAASDFYECAHRAHRTGENQ